MPTLSGWLLQYPVVYLADAETAPTMASLLSQATLQLYQLQVKGTLIEVDVQSQLLRGLPLSDRQLSM